MPDAFCTLGAADFIATNIEIGARPRTIITCATALSSAPVQVGSFIPDLRPITLEGYLQGVATLSETAPAHLRRMRSNLKAVVASDSSTLTIHWKDGATESYSIGMNQDYALQFLPSVQEINRAYFSLTLSSNT